MPILPGTGVAPNRDSFSRSYVAREYYTEAIKCDEDTYLTNEDRAPEQQLLRELSDGTLGVLLRSKLDDTARLVSLCAYSSMMNVTHPHPLETPVGVTRTSAKRTSPANNPKRKLPSINHPLNSPSVRKPNSINPLPASASRCNLVPQADSRTARCPPIADMDYFPSSQVGSP